jgi:tungstate transport system substrate-binding protein
MNRLKSQSNHVFFLSLMLFFTLFIQAPAFASNNILRLATTTSTQNSGLLNDILPVFEKETGMTVKVIAVGTGKALKLGENGDVDVVLVHARPAEDKFMADNHGVNRRDVMYNDFVIVGPADDPAGIKGMQDVAKAFAAIAKNQSTFISRGDDSGTNKKEIRIWKAADITPEGNWYRSAGQGMGRVLQMAGEMGAYTLTDRGTWLAYQAKLPLQILMQGDKRMFNPYGVMAVNPQKYADVNYMGAMQLIAWLTSVEGQHMIREFRINGNQLFTPEAIAN